MADVLKALILVGGYGTRLRPLTLAREHPKPLVEFANEPMILHQIRALVEVGVTEVILAYRDNALGAPFMEFKERLAKDPFFKDTTITLSKETEALGTAGPLALARDHLENTDLFFVLNSDIICEFPFKALLEFHRKAMKEHNAEGTIMVTKVNEPSKYGVVVSNEQGQILSFVEKPVEFVSNRVNAGMYCLTPRILKRIKAEPTSIEKDVFPKIVQDSNSALFCLDLEGFWMDVGQPPDFLKGTKLYLAHLKRKSPEKLSDNEAFKGNVVVHPTAKVAPGAVLGPNVVIGPDCTVEAGSRIINSTIFAGTSVASNSFISDCLIGWKCKVGQWVRMQGGCVVGENVTVQDELFINGCKILHNKTIRSDCPDAGVIM